MPRQRRSFMRRHGLSVAAIGILGLWLILYSISDERTHWGSFFGNAIADWSGVVVMILATKHLYERHSQESKEPAPDAPWHSRAMDFIRDHSLTIFLIAPGALWVWLFARSDPEFKWGQVVGNIVSEWTQILGLVLLTKKLIEIGSKESAQKGGGKSF